MQAKGFITEGTHEGYYSVNEAAFIPSKEIAHESGKHLKVDTGEELELLREKNYVFKISADLREEIQAWLMSEAVQPERLRNKLLDDLEQRGLEISVSRPTSRISWGIQVPGDREQTIYVWLDALVNYLTVVGYPGEKFN